METKHMKKKPAVLAILMLAGIASTAANAQSSVTIFGIVDAAVSHYSVKSSYYSTSPLAFAPIGASQDQRRSQTVLSTGANLPSRLGFRGTEDLGGGLAASFWLESPIGNDDGSLGLATFARRSTVSLSGPFGEVRLGRDYTPTFWTDTLYDPLNNTGVGGNVIGSVNAKLAVVSALSGGGLLNGGLPAGPDNYVRTANSIGYFLPPNIGGVYGQLQYALHENTKSTDVPSSPSRRGAEAAVRLGYVNGPFDVSGSYVESTPVDAMAASGVPTQRKIKSAGLGMSYDLGPAKLFGELSQVRDETHSATPAGALGLIPWRTSDKYSGALIGVTVPVGPGLIRAAYSRVKFRDDTGPLPQGPYAADTDAQASKLAVGYLHNLSKRTALYATIARIRIRNGQNNAAVMGVTAGGTPAYLASGPNAGYAPRSAVGYDFGIRHVF
jgi:predicted porin